MNNKKLHEADIESLVQQILSIPSIKEALLNLKSDDDKFSDKDARDTWVYFLRNLVINVWTSNYILPTFGSKGNPVTDELKNLKKVKKYHAQMVANFNLTNSIINEMQIFHYGCKPLNDFRGELEKLTDFIDGIENEISRIGGDGTSPFDKFISASWKLTNILSKDRKVRKSMTVQMCSIVYVFFKRDVNEDAIVKAVTRCFMKHELDKP